MTDLVTFPLWNPACMVISALRNMAYFLLQMSSQGIYLLNCKGRKIIHISVIRHARNTSHNSICLVIKKEKALVWYYVDLKSLPEGFYSLIILPFSPLISFVDRTPVRVSLHPQCWTNYEQRWQRNEVNLCFFEETRGSRTHLHNICTQWRKKRSEYISSEANTARW